jgi:predicted metal-dependent peptidase
MSEYDIEKCERKVRAARMALCVSHPFFGDLSFGMPFEFREDITLPNGQPMTTAGTDGKKIYFHPKFVLELSPQETIFLLAHEILHPALMHTVRRGPRDPGRWNVAADIVINYLLTKEGVGSMPKCGINDPAKYNDGGGKTEAIYDLLKQEEEQSGKRCGDPGAGAEGNGSMDICMDTPADDADSVSTQWKAKLAQAAQTAKAAGKLPGVFEDFVNNILDPKIPWTTVLRQFLITSRGEERTWSKPNRRYMSSDIYLPGTYGVKAGEIAVLVDCSGSVSEAMIQQAFAEITSIHKEVRPERLHIMYFDTAVKKHDEFEVDDEFEGKAYGRGGTIFRTAFEYIESKGLELTQCVVLTDLECSDFGPCPAYPVLWVSDRLGTAPWGQIIIAD